MEVKINKSEYDIVFAEDGDVFIMLDYIEDFKLKSKDSAIFNIKITMEEDFTARIIKDSENILLLEEFPLEAGAHIEDKKDIVITELNDEGNIAETYLAKVAVGKI